MSSPADHANLEWTEYLAVVLSFAVSVGLSVQSAAQSQNEMTDDFNKNKLPFGSIIMSMIASTTSGVTLLGKPAEAYMHGTAFFNFYAFALFMQLATVLFLFLPVLKDLETPSLYDYFELRFDHRVRRLTTIVFIILKVLYSSTTTIPPAIVISQFSGWDINLIIFVISSVTIFYTTLGGFKGVVLTDAFQGVVMFLSMAMLTVISVYEVGGLSEVIMIAFETNRIELPEFLTADVTSRTSIWVYFGFTYSLSATLLNHSTYQRIKSLSSQDSIKTAVKLQIFGMFVMSLCASFVGLAIYAFYCGCDPKMSEKVSGYSNLVVYWLNDIGGNIVGLRGIYIAGITCAAISTLSTNINSAADLVCKDVWKVTPHRRLYILRLASLFLGTLSAILAIFLKNASSLVELSFSVITLEGVITSLFILGVVVVPSNARGALAGGVCSLLTTLFVTIGSRIYSHSGPVHYGTKLMRTDLCATNITQEFIARPAASSNSNTSFFIFRISPFCLGVITVVITLLVGTTVSLLFPVRTVRNPNLYAPVVRRFLKKSATMSSREMIALNRHEIKCRVKLNVEDEEGQTKKPGS